MLKILAKFFLFLGLMFLLVGPVGAEEQLPIYFFYSKSCPHCAKEKPFLEGLETKYSGVKLYSFEVSENIDNARLLIRVGQALEADVAGGPVPFTVVGDKYLIGYLDDQTYGAALEREALACLESKSCPDLVGQLVSENVPTPTSEVESQIEKKEEMEVKKKSEERVTLPEKIKVPLLGEIEFKSLSLPLLTLIFGLLDGFNPCAMWVLLFLISLLLGMKNKTKMWVLGAVFIFVSGLVYFLFLSAWLNLFLFLGLVFWVRVMVGLVALAAGGYYLRDYWINRQGGCQVVGDNKRQKVFEKIRAITKRKEFWLALLGIALLAVAVNVVELICSAGLPAIYTQVLTMTSLPRWQYYFYLLLYILFFMLDDIIVFVIAMVTLRAVGVESKYARYSRLIGGIVMLLIGLGMLLKPEWLMFG